MSRVSYQAILPDPEEPGEGTGTERFLPLEPGALGTRRKEARREMTVRVSSAQQRWLKEVEDLAGRGIDASAVVRALVDLGRELDVDWSVLAGGSELREAVRRAVLVRRDGAPGPERGEDV